MGTAIGYKHCNDCNTDKPIEMFYFQNGYPLSYCKECYCKRSTEYNKGGYSRWYYANNRDRIRANVRAYNATEQGQSTRARGRHKRKDKESNTECTLTSEQWNKILQSQNNACNICGEQFTADNPATRDHIIPVSKGGGLTFENVQALCASCNSSKKDRIDKSNIISWLQYPEQQEIVSVEIELCKTFKYESIEYRLCNLQEGSLPKMECKEDTYK